MSDIRECALRCHAQPLLGGGIGSGPCKRATSAAHGKSITEYKPNPQGDHADPKPTQCWLFVAKKTTDEWIGKGLHK